MGWGFPDNTPITSENTPSTLQADLSWSDLGAPRPRLSVCPGGHLAVTLHRPRHQMAHVGEMRVSIGNPRLHTNYSKPRPVTVT